MKHIGIDHPVTKEKELDLRMVQHLAQFDRSKLRMFWNKVNITVLKVMLICKSSQSNSTKYWKICQVRSCHIRGVISRFVRLLAQ